MIQFKSLETISNLSQVDIVDGNFSSPYEEQCRLCGSDGCKSQGVFYLCHLCSHAINDQGIIASYLQVLRQDIDPADFTLDTFGKRKGFGFISIIHQGIDAKVIISFLGNAISPDLKPE